MRQTERPGTARITPAEYLRRGREERPHLAPDIDLHLALLDARAEVVALPPPSFTRAEVRGALAAGTPLLHVRPPNVDWDAWTRFLALVCELAAAHRPDLAAEFDRLVSRAPDLVELGSCYLRDGRVCAEGLDHELLTFAFIHAFYPTLRACAEVLGPLADEHETLWYRPRCPICGELPDFASLDSESGARRLLCCRCDHEWQYRRLGCPFCGEANPARIGYYPSADNRYRLYACVECGRYLKVADLREFNDAAPLPALRVLTLDMDLAACRNGL